MIRWTGACFTVLLGRRLSDWLLRRTGRRVIARSWLAAGYLLLTTVSFALISQAHTVPGVISLMTLANALNSMPNAVYWAVIVDSARGNRAVTYSGLTHFVANTASFIGPTLTGYLTVRYGYSAMFIAAAIATAVGMSAMLTVRPAVRQRTVPSPIFPQSEPWSNITI
jgi:MFS transporter, ACS family, hexuronate transporter